MQKRNSQFEILSTLAMLFTVMGHTGVGAGTIEGFFPYDSFHMPLFVFISGYFFNAMDVGCVKTGTYAWKQVKKLIFLFLHGI